MPLEFLDRDPDPQPVDANAKILRLMQKYLESKGRQGNTLLPLVVVTATCEASQGMLAPSDVFHAYLSYEDELAPLAMEAFELKSFEKLRKTVVLRKVRPNFTPDEGSAKLEKHATRVSWDIEYQGRAAWNLQLAIRDMDNNRTPGQAYANMMTILQSSGTGKSRMVDQLALRVFTIPFNLRDPAETTQGAYPDPDSGVFDVFVNNPMGENKFQAAARFGAFLVALFDRVVKALTLHDPSVSLPQWWYQYLLQKDLGEGYGNNREKLYMGAVKNHDAIFAEIQSKVTQRMIVPHDPNVIWQEVAKKYMTDSARTLGKKVIELSRDGLMVIYFDESHTLFKRPLNDGSSRYQALCKALDYLSELSIFSLFLSTNSSLSRYAPSKDDAFSARISEADAVQAPFTELPFDCHPKFPISQGQYTLQTSGELGFLCRFGRPLFWTRYESAIDSQAQQTVIALAERKLAPALVTPHITDVHSDLAELAVLDIRLLLNFDGTGGGKEAEENMVAGKMRIAHSVPQHRYYMHSSYPSEPILAEAAASIWSKYQRRKGALAIPRMLQRHLATPLIEMGERGELVARLILTLAYDAAVRRHPGTLFTYAVPLESFLQELFGDINYERIANSKPDDGNDTFREAFKNAYIRFTHFVRAGDESAVSTEAAYAAILRSMAFQCSHRQEKIDIVIPVALRNEELKEEIMTGILISVKDPVTASTKVSIDVDASRLSFFPEDQELFGDTYLRPYISLVVELGIVPKKKHDAAGSEDVEPPKKKSRKSRKPKVEPASLDVGQPGCASPPGSPQLANPRYRIYAYGCSESVYKVVTDEDVFASLLSSTWLAEHPRQDDAFLEAVKQQKPFWSRGTEFYGWLKDVKTLHDSSFTKRVGVEVDKGRIPMEKSKGPVLPSKQKETVEPKPDVSKGRDGGQPSKKGKEPAIKSKYSRSRK